METAVNWERKRLLITGATGFLGRYVVNRLRERGARVWPSTSPNDPAPAPQAGTLRTFPTLTFDVRDGKAVRSAIDRARPDVVFHLAAVGVTDPCIDPMLALQVNAGGAVNLLEALRKRDVERVVLVGTSYEYGETSRRLDPFNAYSASKVAAWAFARMYWRAHDLPIVIVRPFQVYGPGQSRRSLIPAAIEAALSGEDFSTTPGEQERDFVFAPDVADGMIAAAEAEGVAGESLDLGTGTGIAVRNVVERIWELAGAEGAIRLGALPYRTGSAMHLVADAERTAQLTGWQATTRLDAGLRATMKQVKFNMQQEQS
ncbi:MAG: NAD(P)-dependent oxidoreductase [Anaerolineae bacterium]